MFGWTLIREEELDLLYRGAITRSKVTQCHRWFAGWKDLDIIWEFLLDETYFGTIASARDKYAEARGTDAYGRPTKPKEGSE